MRKGAGWGFSGWDGGDSEKAMGAWCREIEVLKSVGLKSHQSCRRSTMDGIGRRGMTLISNGCCGSDGSAGAWGAV